MLLREFQDVLRGRRRLSILLPPQLTQAGPPRRRADRYARDCRGTPRIQRPPRSRRQLGPTTRIVRGSDESSVLAGPHPANAEPTSSRPRAETVWPSSGGSSRRLLVPKAWTRRRRTKQFDIVRLQRSLNRVLKVPQSRLRVGQRGQPRLFGDGRFESGRGQGKRIDITELRGALDAVQTLLRESGGA